MRTAGNSRPACGRANLPSAELALVNGLCRFYAAFEVACVAISAPGQRPARGWQTAIFHVYNQRPGPFMPIQACGDV